MASSELLESLSRRKERTEALGAVFEVEGQSSGADVVWDRHIETQFTPRQRAPAPLADSAPHVASTEAQEVAAHDPGNRLTMSSVATISPPTTATDLRTLEAPATAPASPRVSTGAPSPGELDLPLVIEALQSRITSRGLEERFEEELRSMAALSMSSSSYFQKAEVRNTVASQRNSATAATSETAATAGCPAAGRLDPPRLGSVFGDQLSMTWSSSYDAQNRGHPQPVSAPFPRARTEAKSRRIEEVSNDVVELRESLNSFSREAEMEGSLPLPAHPVELAKLVAAAEALLNKLRPGEVELLPWPGLLVAEARRCLSHLESWQTSEAASRRAISSANEVPLEAALGLLDQLLASWHQLRQVSRDSSLHVDFGLDRRAKSVGPMAAALLDQAFAAIAKSTTSRGRNAAVFRLEKLLQWATSVGGEELGLGPSTFASSLEELQELLVPQGSQALHHEKHAEHGGAKELWQAVVEGDVQKLLEIMRRGDLTSGRLADDNGHSVLWHAIAWKRVDIALLLLRHFPPASLHGVDITELHPRTANSLLHIAAALPWAPGGEAEPLFLSIFDAMPESLWSHRNSRGQSFAHIAAATLNFGLLRLAIARGLAALLVLKDDSGASPQSLLAKQLLSDQETSLSSPNFEESRLPAWFPLAACSSLFADAVIEVFDGETGELHTMAAHRIVLAAYSDIWHHMLTDAARRKMPAVLQIAPEICASPCVLRRLIAYLYSSWLPAGELTASESLQLLRLSADYQIRGPLQSLACHALLSRAAEPAEPGVATVIAEAFRCHGRLGIDAQSLEVLAIRQLALPLEAAQSSAAESFDEALAILQAIRR